MKNIVVQPLYGAVLSNYNTKAHVLIRIQAPSVPKEKNQRPPLQLGLVLDRSGSMSGAPLRESVRCAEYIINSLSASDFASLVVYDSVVDTLVPLQRLGEKKVFKQALHSISSKGMTNLHGGWHASAKGLKPQKGMISRVLLLSDGRVNRGVTDTDEIKTACSRLLDTGVSTSTYGLGDNFNEDLMIAMSESGGGNSYYGETAEDLMDPFMEEFDLLSSLYAVNIRLRIEETKGYTINVLNRFRQDKIQHYCLPNIAYDSEGWVLLEIDIPKEYSGNGDGRKALLLGSIHLCYDTMDGTHIEEEPIPVSLPSLGSHAFESLSKDPLVEERLQEIRASDIQEEAVRAARRGDWVRLHQLLDEAEEIAKDNEWLQQVVGTLKKRALRRNSKRLSKELRYSSRKMKTRLAAQKEDAWARDGASFLRKKIEQGKKQEPTD
ncbi:MAG: VWA domain-containing protein [Myxococcota bacterium]|nr:VWA domain-containing protein [Myxococcota bacterium]